MNAAQARAIYEEIVRRQRDPALVEWMGYGMLRARIFPIAPGEEKKVVVRYQMVAEREGDALRVDYYQGKRSGNDMVRFAGRSGEEARVIVHADISAAIGVRQRIFAYAFDQHNRRAGRREVSVMGNASEITLLMPMRRSTEPAISCLHMRLGGKTASR